ncbi:conserved hypothetical protein (modular protein) [Nitrospina gracilis 3/211]|uniref:Uncharacterized protein n=1 Tax=Nitrospina gracilis (strain 3/211) TaxID=1266370 RepID=M1YN34_NITG3|nr:conserved hypothetical protein (modular protein) [Nitrospina gracilis 3/211]
MSQTPAPKLPFPVEWIKTQPQKVEELLNKLSVADQARCVLQLHGVQQQALILLSKQAMSVVRALPDEELYQTVKEIGQEDALPLIAICSQKQLQFMFDMEWWQADKFSPKRAVEWLALVADANDQQILHWLYTEDFDQKVMVLQSLIKVYKRDEMTDQYENVENLPHYSPDGVYDIYFKDAEAEKPLTRIFKMLYSENQKLLHSLMEGVIWYGVTPTVETSYRWYLSRNEERGVLSFEEAFQVYSLLDAQTLKESLPSADDFRTEDIRHTLAPAFPLEDLDPGTFFGQCLAIVKSAERFHAISWELAWLFHKVMVADRRDFADIHQRHEAMRKLLGYINIGLELGAGGGHPEGRDPAHQNLHAVAVPGGVRGAYAAQVGRREAAQGKRTAGGVRVAFGPGRSLRRDRGPLPENRRAGAGGRRDRRNQRPVGSPARAGRPRSHGRFPDKNPVLRAAGQAGIQSG